MTQQRLIDVLRDRPLGSQAGFSGYLAALGRERTPELWLTQFAINGSTGALELAGRSTRPELVPEYLQRLGREQALAGQRFDALEIEHDADERRSRVSRHEPGGGADRGRPRCEAPAMKERITKLTEIVDRLSLRERLFVFAAGLVILGGLWEAALASPLDARKLEAAAKVEALKDRLQVLDTALASAATGMTEGMPAQISQLTALRDRVAAGDQEVRVFTSDLVDPKEMRLVLEELLSRQSGLKLVSATNLPAKPLVERDAEPTGAKDDSAKTKAKEPQLYRHALVLTLEGSYLDCLAYLTAVERLPWHLYWSRIEFKEDGYPRNAIVLELRTLSLDKEWIGV